MRDAPETYRRKAEEASILSAETPDPFQARMYQKIAAHWRDLAARLDRQSGKTEASLVEVQEPAAALSPTDAVADALLSELARMEGRSKHMPEGSQTAMEDHGEAADQILPE